MPDKLTTYVQLAEDTTRAIMHSHETWTAFLSTAARMYKYAYNDQLMIHAQRPAATACAPYEVWNQKMSRYVRRCWTAAGTRLPCIMFLMWRIPAQPDGRHP